MPTVIAMDLNPFVLRFCQMVLSKAGYTVMVSEVPLEGLTHLENSTEISAILLDVDFISPSTEALLQGLEKRSKTCNIPVVLLGNGEQKSPFEELFPAVLQTLAKPLSPVSLLDTLQTVTKGNVLTQIRSRRKKIQSQSSANLSSDLSADLPQGPHPAYPSMTQIPALQGRIEFMPLGEVFQLLRFQNQTGIFHILNKEKEVFIFFENGAIQLATSKNFTHEFQLGRMLLQRRALKPALLNKILHQRNQDNTPLGEYLVNGHFIDEKFLQTALRDQTCILIYELLRWKSGEFAFLPCPSLPLLAQKARLDLSVEELVLEGFRRLDEWNVLENEVGSRKTVLVRTPQSTALLNHLSPLEQNILQNINGTLSIEDITERVLLPTFDVYKVCKELVTKNIVKRLRAEESLPSYDA